MIKIKSLVIAFRNVVLGPTKKSYKMTLFKSFLAPLVLRHPQQDRKWNILNGLLVKFVDGSIPFLKRRNRTWFLWWQYEEGQYLSPLRWRWLCPHYTQDVSISHSVSLTHCDLMDSSPPSSSVHGILQRRTLEWVAIPSPGVLPNAGIEPASPHCRQILYKLSHQRSPRVVVCYYNVIVVRFRNWVLDNALWEWLLLEEKGLQSEQWLNFRSIRIPGGLMNKLRTGSIASLTIPPSDLNLLTTATANSLQLCPTLCDPMDDSLPGSPVPGILQARTLEWVAISFSNAWKWKVKVKSLSCVRICATP